MTVDKLKANLAKSQTRGIALDIDETLSNTVKWWFSKMIELFGNPENLDWKGIYDKYRHSSKIPYWQTDEIKQWMEERREDNSIQTEIEVLEGAVENVAAIHKFAPVVAYVTARPESVIPGTKNWLEMHDFPEAPIVTRPNGVSIENGNKWKAGVIEKLFPYVQAIVDDNVDFPLEISDNYKGTIYLYNYETDPTGGRINVVPCKTWNEVLISIKREKMP